MASSAVTQAMINDSFGLKRLLALTEEYVQNKISSAVDYAAETANDANHFDRSNLRTDQCFALSLLYGLIKKDIAFCSILGMSSEFFEPLAVTQIFPWLRDSFKFTRDDLMSALQYGAKLKKQQISIPDSAFKAIVQLAKDCGVIAQTPDDRELMELLESLAIDERPVNDEVQRSLQDAVVANSSDRVGNAISAGADPNYVLEGGMTCLHLAVNKKCLESATALLASGAKVDVENSEGETPLCLAVRDRYLPMINLLLSKGAKVNYLNASGHSAIHIAAREGFADVVDMLIDVGGADTAVPDSSGYTALHWAAANGREEMVRMLNSKGASVNTISKNGWTPLHAASEYNHKNVASLLIDCGADVNALGDGGFTPVHMAADKGHVDVVRLLVIKGANPFCKSNDGSTPADMAKDSGHKEVMEYFQALKM